MLKHKNTIICLQIFWKHVNKLQKTRLLPVLFTCVFHVGMTVFVLVCVTPPTANLTNSISTARVASWQKTQQIAAMGASKQTGSEMADSDRPKKPRHQSKKLYDQRNIKTRINQLNNLHCLACHFSLSIAIVPLAYLNLATHMNVESEEEQAGEMTNILNLDCSTHFNH